MSIYIELSRIIKKRNLVVSGRMIFDLYYCVVVMLASVSLPNIGGEVSIPVPVFISDVFPGTEELFIVMFSWANTGVLDPINKIAAANTLMTANERI